MQPDTSNSVFTFQFVLRCMKDWHAMVRIWSRKTAVKEVPRAEFHAESSQSRLLGPSTLDLHANPNYRNSDKKSFWCLLRCNSPFARRLPIHQWEAKSIFRQRLHMAKCVWRIENHLERRQHSFDVTKKSYFRQAMECDRCNISFSSSRYHSMAHE